MIAACTPLPHVLPLAVFTVPLSQGKGTQRLFLKGRTFSPMCSFTALVECHWHCNCKFHVTSTNKTVFLLTHNRQHFTEMDLPLAGSTTRPRLKTNQKKTPVLSVVRDVNTNPEVAHPTLDKPSATEITKVQ